MSEVYKEDWEQFVKEDKPVPTVKTKESAPNHEFITNSQFSENQGKYISFCFR